MFAEKIVEKTVEIVDEISLFAVHSQTHSRQYLYHHLRCPVVSVLVRAIDDDDVSSSVIVRATRDPCFSWKS